MDCSNRSIPCTWTSLATRFWLTGWSASKSIFRRTWGGKNKGVCTCAGGPYKVHSQRTDCPVSALGGVGTRPDGSKKSPRCAWRALSVRKCTPISTLSPGSTWLLLGGRFGRFGRFCRFRRLCRSYIFLSFLHPSAIQRQKRRKRQNF